MESKIKKVRKDLRALKSTSHAIERIIEVQGIHFLRINALEKLPKNKRIEDLLAKEKEMIKGLGLEEQIERSEEIEKKYMGAISTLDVTDRAMVLDCFLKGKPYYKIAMDYGFSEGGLRKRLDRLVKQIAEKM